MSKFTVVLVIVALAVSAQAWPTYEDDISAAAAAGNWDKVHEILSRSFGNKFMFKPQPGVGEVRNLRPQGGGHVYAESDVNFKSTSNNNGQYTSQSGGHRIVNNDGAVSEYDYKP